MPPGENQLLLMMTEGKARRALLPLSSHDFSLIEETSVINQMEYHCDSVVTTPFLQFLKVCLWMFSHPSYPQ